ncbi:MAG: tyrosine-type recombinase/integrase [Acidimicrobiia bacterium]
MRGRIYRHHGSRGATWRFIVDLAPDPATGRRRQQRGSGFRTRKEAEAALNELLASNRAAAPAKAGRQTVREFLEEWLVANKPPTLSPTTWRGYVDLARKRVIPRIGAVRLDALTPKVLRDLYTDLRENGTGRNGGLAPQSVKNTYTFVNRALEDAVRMRILKENPNRLAPRPKVPKTEADVWSPEEASAFLARSTDDPLWPAWLLLLTTGMRRGEIVGLRWRDVDFEDGRVIVRQNVVAAGYDVHAKDPKTTGSRRTVALDAVTVDSLRQHRRRVEQLMEALGGTLESTTRVFLSEVGEELHPQSFTYRFRKAAERAGLRPISIRDGRHTSATIALAAKTHPKIVSERLGHADIRITLDTYSHVMEDLQREAAENISALLQPANRPKGRKPRSPR